MSKIYKGVMELVGNTPLVEVVNIEQQEKLKATGGQCQGPGGKGHDRGCGAEGNLKAWFRDH